VHICAYPYFGEHPLVESHYLAKRGRRQPSILVFLAQDADAQVFCYANADIRKGEEADEIFRFIDFWKRQHGKAPQHLVFDSKLTTCAGFDRLDAAGITFITLRRRSPKLLAEVTNMPASAWRTVELDVPHRKYRGGPTVGHPSIPEKSAQRRSAGRWQRGAARRPATARRSHELAAAWPEHEGSGSPRLQSPRRDHRSATVIWRFIMLSFVAVEYEPRKGTRRSTGHVQHVLDHTLTQGRCQALQLARQIKESVEHEWPRWTAALDADDPVDDLMPVLRAVRHVEAAATSRTDDRADRFARQRAGEIARHEPVDDAHALRQSRARQQLQHHRLDR
jgi:hypothetical protein